MAKRAATMSIVKKFNKKIDKMEFGDYTKKQAVTAYMEIALKLHDLQVGACRHISRADNNRLFEMAFFIANVADRIEKEYKEATGD